MKNKYKILAVDDELDVVAYLTAIFEDNGYDTVTATGGSEAFELARNEHPDLITLDITMPDQSGVRTYRNIKEDPELKDIPVIVLTATVNTAQSFLDLLNGFPGPEGFLNKPIDTGELLKLTEALIAGEKGP